ncbi:hypothetical protein BDK51DRAFT_31743 [Blyttiomyces helicus]|uniref:Uncharacterized protein n=1 Tax=Blyttiomyces helicus TaxID=388810 RepID=A0A4P9WR21_9FUNG|nr:hypothetical protein BDK51DRAFT_31743 [Blyttiomyces helicus]|eukprot:RKO94663.1 hypothetical protein BDK51DRAFT_31743 [Blyttiomyces helicus]
MPILHASPSLPRPHLSLPERGWSCRSLTSKSRHRLPRHDGHIYPREYDSDNLAASSEGKRRLFLKTFSEGKLPILNLSIAGFRQNAGFIHVARKLNLLRRQWGIEQLESSLPERAYTYPAAVARLQLIFKHIRQFEKFYDLHGHHQKRLLVHHLGETALSKMGSSLIPMGLTADDASIPPPLLSEHFLRDHLLPRQGVGNVACETSDRLGHQSA